MSMSTFGSCRRSKFSFQHTHGGLPPSASPAPEGPVPSSEFPHGAPVYTQVHTSVSIKSISKYFKKELGIT